VVADCGCGAPAAPATGGGLSLFSGLRGNQGGCGCDAAPAPAPVADCGCGAPVVGGGLGVAKKPFSGLRSMFRKTSHGACGFAPIAAAPIAAAPVADCGCGSPAPAPVADCGCGSPAPVSDCGCGGSAVTPCGFTGGGGSRGPLTLMDRLRGNRIPRTREGVVIGTEGSNGCNPPCPQAPAPAAGCGCGGPVHQEGAVYQEAAPCTSCGGGEVVYGEAQPTSGCTTCGTGEGEIIYGDPLSVPGTPAITSEGTSASPVLPPAGGSSTKSEAIQNATEGVIEAGGGASEASPVVDPGAFVPRKGRTTVGG